MNDPEQGRSVSASDLADFLARFTVSEDSENAAQQYDVVRALREIFPQRSSSELEPEDPNFTNLDAM